MDLSYYIHRLPPLDGVTGDCLTHLHMAGAFSGLLGLNSSTGFYSYHLDCGWLQAQSAPLDHEWACLNTPAAWPLLAGSLAIVWPVCVWLRPSLDASGSIPVLVLELQSAEAWLIHLH